MCVQNWPKHWRKHLAHMEWFGAGVGYCCGNRGTPLTLKQIEHLQNGKTGALIEWSAISGAIMARADITPLSTYAKAVGFAFQIADDILDVEETRPKQVNA